MRHLISFLGKVPKDKENGKYSTVNYRFSDDTITKTNFFGLALQQNLKPEPERLVVLGTTGSMWDVFVEHFDLADALEEERTALIDNADQNKVTQEQLDKLAPLISQKLDIQCELRIIPYGKTEQEQIEILQAIAMSIKEGDSVSLDVTHGLRHLPMLTLTSSFYLKSVLKVQIEGIYYGAFDMRVNNIAPVIKLDGLLHIANWVSALDAFDKDQDYSVFAELLMEDGLDVKQADNLKKAAFYERNFNTAQANQVLSTFSLPTNLTGASKLFATSLEERLNRTKGTGLFERQKKLAEFYLENCDYVRATIFSFEAFITGKEPSTDYKKREVARKRYESTIKNDRQHDYWQLCNLRNALAHGNEPHENIKQLMTDETKLHQCLQKLMKNLL